MFLIITIQIDKYENVYNVMLELLAMRKLNIAGVYNYLVIRFEILSL